MDKISEIEQNIERIKHLLDSTKLATFAANHSATALRCNIMSIADTISGATRVIAEFVELVNREDFDEKIQKVILLAEALEKIAAVQRSKTLIDTIHDLHDAGKV